jgi:serine/threonine protein kinase
MKHSKKARHFWTLSDHEQEALTLDGTGQGTVPISGPVTSDHIPPAVRAFLRHLQQVGLLGPGSFDGVSKLKDGQIGELDTPSKVGHVLIDAGRLTKYQLDRVLSGATHGLVLGNYRVRDQLGAGAMGVVFLGEHVMMKRQVAIKVLPVDDDCPRLLLDRFYAEMRVLAQLQHPNVVMAFDSGKVESPTSDRPGLLYLVMEYVDGCDLENHVLEHGPLPIGKACNWISQAACGLQEAHNHQLIHRDIKPSNILVTRNGQIKLVDFGLVRQFAFRLTDPGALLGTLDFMPPEQSYDPSSVSSHADIYALGATLFWVLTGAYPFPRLRSLKDSLEQLQHRAPRRLRELRPDAPPALEAIVDRLLEKNPARRPALALMVKKALEPFADHAPDSPS